jgi:hypothetical protein
MMSYQNYFDEKIHQIRIISLAQWDYLKYSHLCDWLDDNFSNDIEGKYYAIKILLHTIYYSKQNMERLLNFGLNEKIYGEIIKSELIDNKNIYIPHSEAEAMVNKLKQKSFFVPLLDSNKPSESGNFVIGDIVHKINISENQVDFHWNLNEELLKNYRILIFVDDCIGSGSQLKKFWNSEKTNSIKAICKKYDIMIYYLVLIGYDKNIKLLKEQQNLTGLKVIVCDKTNNEKEKAIQYFERIRKEKGINFLGFKKLDFAVILHDRLPNWSLPIFWKEMTGWKCLLRRKTTI